MIDVIRSCKKNPAKKVTDDSEHVIDFTMVGGLTYTQQRPSLRPILGLLLLLAPTASAFYLPGVAPRDYLPGEKVELKVNKLTSTKTQ